MAPTVAELDTVVRSFYEGRGEQVRSFCLYSFLKAIFGLFVCLFVCLFVIS